ncbi:MAG: HAMP domain-containing histidine kinase, partial [Lachnospiraceae bacterium]|nr:HAMP domain-containing histidine kinase [Lachnospiraceae bacterium]
MRKVFLLTFFPVFAICGKIFAIPTPLNFKEILSGLNADLAQSTSPTDSIRILENIADLVGSTKRIDVYEHIYDIALRLEDYPKVCDVLRKKANLSLKSDSSLVELLDRTVQLPESEQRDETEAFIMMTRTLQKLRHGSVLDKQNRLNEMLERLSSNPPTDLYTHIILLHAVCAYISDSAQGNLLSKYMDYLGKLIEQLPSEAYSIRNMYYVNAAISYSENGEHEKSIAADKRLLQNIDSIEAEYQRQGRIYRDFDGNRFVIYTRLLSNFDSLTGDEVEDFYEKAKNLVKTNVRASVTYQHSPLIDIYYAMHSGDYTKALPLLKKHINDEANEPKKRQLLKMMITAAEQLGDNQTLLKASTDYNNVLEEYIESKYRERYKELQIVYDIYRMKSDYAKLLESKHQSENTMHRTIIIIACLSCLVLAILLFVLVSLNRKTKHLAKTLAESNTTLKVESENLRRIKTESMRARDMAMKANNLKSDFIKNMSREVSVPLQAITEYSGLIVDCAESSQKKYLERFCQMVELNSELLNTMINDMLSLADLDSSSSSITITRKSVRLYEICEMAVETTKHRVGDGVKMSFVHDGQPDANINVDAQRIQQILINLLVNSAKFTQKGHISLFAHISPDKKSVSFTVEDTGIGVPPEMNERIFDRFYKISKESQGAGLGLTISRLLAKLQDGTLTLDTTYNHGA